MTNPSNALRQRAFRLVPYIQVGAVAYLAGRVTSLLLGRG